MIILNDAEQRLAHYLARHRFENNRNNNVTDRKIGSQSNEETDLNGIGAEIAFCKHFNLYPDTNIDHKPKEDAIMHDGTRVDVKTTKYGNGLLLAPIWKKKIATDLYALMVGEFPEYQFAGCISGEKLFNDEYLIDLGYGTTYGVGQEKLEK